LKDGRAHEYLNVYLALQKSSNIYMARIVHRLIETFGDHWYRKVLVDCFSLGQKTNVELPGEAPGLVPTPGKLHPNGKLEWSLPTPYSLAIGYNLLVNSVQIARIYSIFANGGYRVFPHIVRKIVKPMSDGRNEILLDNTHLGKGPKVLSSEIVETIVKGLKYTTKEGGSSKLADVMGYTEGGKSGTAEKIIHGVYSKDNHISSFVGFVPAKNPRFVLIVSIDDPEKKFIPGIGKHQLGGVCAAPVFREISLRALQYLGVEPDDPYGYPPGDPRRNVAKADWMKEIQELKALYEKWNVR
jgi:cell division protein FtsI (penicillin-binding protein 3)